MQRSELDILVKAETKLALWQCVQHRICFLFYFILGILSLCIILTPTSNYLSPLNTFSSVAKGNHRKQPPESNMNCL